jgi:hypothetical protein
VLSINRFLEGRVVDESGAIEEGGAIDESGVIEEKTSCIRQLFHLKKNQDESVYDSLWKYFLQTFLK